MTFFEDCNLFLQVTNEAPTTATCRSVIYILLNTQFSSEQSTLQPLSVDIETSYLCNSICSLNRLIMGEIYL